ncbi:hypothetical protein PanWU01x14_198360 [Parasponia andersonii]|uniref:Uncharacterized protein n=1 Tax=Parasponia andersonii TaxID=3476 RepID=A0A2P5BYS4_PARAD|nr:hypothetical protein PanWU01x14_198360 [Parasponia andersonii]
MLRNRMWWLGLVLNLSTYCALSHVVAEVIWLQSLFKVIGVSLTSRCPILWCDNMGVGALASNPVFHSRTKHIEVDIHFIRETVINKELEVRYVPSKEQVVDVLTKPLNEEKFLYFRDKLKVHRSPFSLGGSVKKFL